jgi:P-type Cu+ transporter
VTQATEDLDRRPLDDPPFGETDGRPAEIDPVCGMKVDHPTSSKHHAEVQGKLYHFCSAGCLGKFKADPEKYLDSDDTAAVVPTPDGATFTCPMHPQVRQIGPGSCPICGMALEPETPTLETGPNLELLDMKKRLWIGLALTVPIFLLEMGGHINALRLHEVVPEHISAWIQFALSTPVVLWAGWPFFERAWASITNRSLNMFSLIALGTGAAYLYSVVATLAPSIFPAGFRGMNGSVAVYFEAAAVITVLVLLGQVLELRARDQTGGAIRALLQLAPKTARRVRRD